VKELMSVQACWFQFWRDRAGITIPDFELGFGNVDDRQNFKNELTVFLFYVDMVATILREFRNVDQAERTKQGQCSDW